MLQNSCIAAKLTAVPVAITIRDVPDEVRDELAARAARSGQSLQEYLRAVLVESVAVRRLPMSSRERGHELPPRVHVWTVQRSSKPVTPTAGERSARL